MFRLLASSLLMLSFASGAAYSQDPPPKKPQDAETVTIEGQKEPSLTVPSERLATERLNQVPGGTGVVSGEEVRQTRSADLRDVLQNQPGVYISTRNGQEYRLSIRGSGIQRNYHLQGIKLLEDGMPVTLADGFGDFNMISPTAMEYTEIYRGSNGFEYGSASLGGAINFVARTGRWAPEFDVRIEGGSWNFLSGQVAAAHVEADTDVYASYSHYSEDGYRAHSAMDNQHFAGNAGYRFSEAWETRVYLDLVRTVAELPDVLTFDQVHHNPRFADPGPFGATAEDWHRDLDIVRIADKTTWKSGDQQLDLGVYWMLNDLFHPVFWMPGLNIGVVDKRSNDVGGFVRYTNEQQISGMKNRLVAGASSSGNRTLSQRFQNPDGKPGALTAKGFEDAFNLSAYIQDQLWLSTEFSVVAGLQGTYTTRTFTDHFLTDVDGDQSFYANYAGWNPMAGARYQFTPTSQVFANVSRSFEPPQYIELTGIRFDPNGSVFYNPLQAQRATTAEIGTRGKEGPVAWELVYYYSWVQHEIISSNPFPFAQVISNADHTKHEGIELAAEFSLAEGVWAPKTEQKAGDRVYLRPVYTWNNFRFKNDPVYGNNRLPAIPWHIIQAELGYEHPIGAFVGVNVEWVPHVYAADYENTRSADADRYATWGIKAGYRPATGVAFFAEIRNLTNQRYVNSVDQVANATDPANSGAQYHPAYARAYYAGVELRW